MYQKILHFIKYNNAFTIILVIFFFSFGVSFAASEDVREGIYTSAETTISVDNGAIVSADLPNFNFNLRISSITEDDKNYYAAYSYQTLMIEDGIWQNKEVEKTLTVSKEALAGKDLGLYVARELGENMNYELSYLQRVQKLEREKGESAKVVATAYSGLIGKLLDPKEEVIEGYTPVIPEPEPETQMAAAVESNPESVIVSTVHIEPAAEPEESPTSAPASVTETTPEPEATTTPDQSSQITPPDSTATTTPPEGVGDEVLPAPEEMIDEELVQEVVEELLEEEPTPTAEPSPEAPASEAEPVDVVPETPTPTESVGAEPTP